jgi:transcriptional regulator with XRE-family HTH domain
VAGTASSTRLRALREEHGLTQQEVAEQLGKLAFLRMKRHVGVNADMVAKWERGVKAPSKLYRELLGLLFGVSAGELAVVRPTASPPETITPVEEPLLAVRTRKSCERAWQIAGVDSSRADAGDCPEWGQPGARGGVAQARRSPGLAFQGRNRSRAGPVRGFPPLRPHSSR